MEIQINTDTPIITPNNVYFAALNVTTALFALIFVGSLAAAFDSSLAIRCGR